MAIRRKGNIEKNMRQMPQPNYPKSTSLRRTFSPDKKDRIIRVRMPTSLFLALQKKAEKATAGQVSPLIRHYCYIGLKRGK